MTSGILSRITVKFNPILSYIKKRFVPILISIVFSYFNIKTIESDVFHVLIPYVRRQFRYSTRRLFARTWRARGRLEAISVAMRSNFLAEAILFSRLPAKLDAYVSSHSLRSYT